MLNGRFVFVFVFGSIKPPFIGRLCLNFIYGFCPNVADCLVIYAVKISLFCFLDLVVCSW